LRLPEAAAGETVGKTSASLSGAGVDFFGIREWRAGDARSAIHWRASARRNELVVMERERPGHPTLLVAVGPLRADEAQEAVVARGRAPRLHARRDGRRVVLVADGEAESVNRPVDALDWFAGVDPAEPPDSAALGSALQTAGIGSIVLWLGKAAVPELVRA